ncbi:MAG: TrkH family potassium uptake protein [Erysipelotrichia bacterium]|nr:TrkH family potassium uptake protein [Erysipelotrichia bacterium]NCC54527.1 TrkH family potassium uptake protein [Erysipelotrichia bacterium]
MIKKIRKKILLKNAPPARRIAVSFLGVILIGAILLSLPIANHDGQFLNFVDALFTATSATCVTGLVTTVTIEQFNHFGQFVLLCLMQIGGIGLMTLVATFMLILRTRLSMTDKIAIKEMLNQSNILNFKKFLQGILKYVLVLEGLGAFILMSVFVPRFGILEGTFKSIFIAVSAFCNAGFDNLTATSLIPYNTNVVVCVVVMLLIVLGGLGFVVWFDVHDKVQLWKEKKVNFKHFLSSLTLHTKIVLIMSAILIFVPAIMFFIMEYNNPATLGNMSLPNQIMNALFSSITLRTAGFASIPFEQGHMSSQLISIICMFIGGSPGGTAGGIKTTTIAVILICVIRSLRGKQRTNVFNRHISRDIIVRATTIMAINLVVLFSGIFILSITDKFSFMEICFEATSALATVGLTLGITPFLSIGGKLIIIMLMFVGRIGIMTFIMSIVKEDCKSDTIHYAEGHIMVG